MRGVSPRRLAVALCVALSPTAPSVAQSLDEALAQAYQNNPTLLAERARLRATDEGVAQALSNWRPTVSLSGSYTRERVESDSGFTQGTTNRSPNFVGVTIQQNIFRGGRTIFSTQRAKSLVGADRARLSAAEQTVLLNTVQAYVDVVRNQAVVRLNLNNERVLRRQLEATRDRFRVGEVTRTDVAQAESRVARGLADRIDAQSRLVQSRATYKNVVGALPGTLRRPKVPDDIPASEKDAVSSARRDNFSVRQADLTEKAAKARVKEVIGELLPVITLSGEYDESRNTIGSSSTSQSTSVTARLTMPLYQSGGVASRIREAKQVVAQRRNELNQAVRNAVEEGTRSWEALHTSRAQIRSFTAEVRAARIALEGTQQEALVGSRTVLDVLDAEQELLDARVNLVRAQRDEIVAAYRLRAAIGVLTAKKLALKTAPYDPLKNYDRVNDKWFGIGIGSD